jgi:hypothetical protein
MSEDDRRQARRAFVREHHPDRGGDPGAFVEGLARFEVADEFGDSQIVVYRRRRLRVAGTLTWRVLRWRRRPSRVR